ncbi:MAG: prepilin-type N-terminal cleavage/methylation domain-containing protein [Erysipelotrichia bacterium]|nr:prepilin-type N-terminal cleavage/methylation domain-containing protein [Erysipelotrichia bacterium]
MITNEAFYTKINNATAILQAKNGVTLMELLLVVAVLAVIAPLAVPPMTAHMASRNDLATTGMLIDAVSHTRTMGLLGRKTEAVITFSRNSSTVNRGGQTITLPAGFTTDNIKIDGADTADLSTVFMINGNIRCNNADAQNASIDLKRNGTTISTINLNGIGIPTPEISAAVDPANPSAGGGVGGSGGCSWL